VYVDSEPRATVQGGHVRVQSVNLPVDLMKAK
jgi:hypothetical protein